jgi:hypothetical protein
VEDSKTQSFTTYGTTCFKILRPTNELEVIKADLQSRFRSGVGIRLYLNKHSKPYIANVVRELAQCMDGATLTVYREKLRVIRFIFDTQLFCLKM